MEELRLMRFRAVGTLVAMLALVALVVGIQRLRLPVFEPASSSASSSSPLGPTHDTSLPLEILVMTRRMLRGGGGNRSRSRGAHRHLQGWRRGPYATTSNTNGGNVVSRGVPWPPTSIGEAQATYPRNAVGMVNNARYGQGRQYNRPQHDVYAHMPVYARMQARAENPAEVARLQAGLASPAYGQLQARVQNPRFQDRLQLQLYGNARVYQQMADRVSNPAYLTGLQRDLYRGQLRPGPNNVPPQLVNQALAVETRPGRPRLGHVP